MRIYKMTSNKKNKQKLIIITGPTACGKTGMAVKLANDLNAEIISADSRQIYKGMDIGTGKDLDEYKLNDVHIPYHLIDILDPMENYSVYSFQKDFNKAFNNILNKNKIPILCGGTGLYIESILLDYNLSNKPPPDEKLRSQLSTFDKDELLVILSEISSDEKMKGMLLSTRKQIIRNIEIIKSSIHRSISKINPLNNIALIIGLQIDRELLRSKIKIRLNKRISNGMIEEVEDLISNGMPLDRLEYFGLEYGFVGKYIKDEISKEQMIDGLTTAIRRFAKRQRTWFRRMEKRGVKINWVDYNDYNQIAKLSLQYLNEL